MVLLDFVKQMSLLTWSIEVWEWLVASSKGKHSEIYAPVVRCIMERLTDGFYPGLMLLREDNGIVAVSSGAVEVAGKASTASIKQQAQSMLETLGNEAGTNSTIDLKPILEDSFTKAGLKCTNDSDICFLALKMFQHYSPPDNLEGFPTEFLENAIIRCLQSKPLVIQVTERQAGSDLHRLFGPNSTFFGSMDFFNQVATTGNLSRPGAGSSASSVFGQPFTFVGDNTPFILFSSPPIDMSSAIEARMADFMQRLQELS